jgi:dihydrofolate synthase/folylpolyglutamate synthase
MHTLDEWLVQIESRHPAGRHGIELGLARVSEVARRLGHRQRAPLITVGGTNGKGSTCAYLERIYCRAGLRVGCYTSPHLLAYNERIRIDGVPADDAALVRAFTRVEAARGAAPAVPLTYFEFGTLAAWEVFAESAVGLVILEVGLGGRLDAVNIYDPDLAVLTGVAIDHAAYLGADREAIGAEKAEIFRPGRPAIVADAAPPHSVLAAVHRIGAKLRLIGHDFGYQTSGANPLQWTWWTRRDGQVTRRILAHPGLRGVVQLANAAAAVEAVEALRERLPVSMQAIRQGLIETELPGRFQVIPGRPALVLDVAHNPQSAQVLAGNLSSMGFFPVTTAVVGMMADKDIDGTLAPLLERIDRWCCASLPPPRGAAADELAERLRKAGAREVHCFATVAEALGFATETSGEADRIAAFGSFVTAAETLRRCGLRSGRG